MIFAAGECRSAERFLIKRQLSATCVDAGKVAERCRASGLEFKLQLVYSKENNLKVEL